MFYIVKVGDIYIYDIYRKNVRFTKDRANAFRWKTRRTARYWASYVGGVLNEVEN